MKGFTSLQLFFFNYNNVVIFIKKVYISMVLISFLIISSGCINGTNNAIDQDIDSLIVVENLPEGYEYLGPYPDFSEYNNDSENIINSGQGIYKDQSNKDVYLDVIEFDTESSAIIFIEEYKSRKESVTSGDIFSYDTINGHSVTRMKTYSISKGTQEPRYSFFWNDDKYVFIVKSNSDDENSALNVVKAII